MLEAKGIKKRFGRTAVLKGIDLTVREGEFVTVFGANGAGKTTFLKIAAMLLSPSDGEIFFQSENTKNDRNLLRRRIGYIAHSSFLYKNLTARENLRFFGKMYNVDEVDETVARMLNAVNLFERKDDVIRSFSRGMIQRLTIARAFLHSPLLLLLDEPYTGLDRSASEILNGLITSFYSSKNAGIMTTHNLEQGYDIATHVAIMSAGKIQYFEETKNITRNELMTKYKELVG